MYGCFSFSRLRQSRRGNVNCLIYIETALRWFFLLLCLIKVLKTAVKPLQDGFDFVQLFPVPPRQSLANHGWISKSIGLICSVLIVCFLVSFSPLLWLGVTLNLKLRTIRARETTMLKVVLPPSSDSNNALCTHNSTCYDMYSCTLRMILESHTCNSFPR